MHCTLHTTHHALHTTHCTLHTAHYTLHTAHCTLPTTAHLLFSTKATLTNPLGYPWDEEEFMEYWDVASDVGGGRPNRLIDVQEFGWYLAGMSSSDSSNMEFTIAQFAEAVLYIREDDEAADPTTGCSLLTNPSPHLSPKSNPSPRPSSVHIPSPQPGHCGTPLTHLIHIQISRNPNSLLQPQR